MSQQKRRKRHKCINHKKRIARGKCSRCGAWICSECARIEKGTFFCRDNCMHLELEPSISEENSDPATREMLFTKKKNTFTNPVIILSLITINLCAVAISLWALRVNFQTREEIRSLSKQIRVNHSNLTKMKKVIVRLDKKEGAKKKEKEAITGDSVPAKMKSAPRQLPQLNYNKNMPASFDNGTFNKKLVALTFDGGSHSNSALPILDTLRSRGVKSTMFLTGNFIRRHKSLVRQILKEGHEIGNHTESHPHLTSWAQDRTHRTLPSVTEVFLKRQLEKANQTYRSVTGESFVPLWRAPYGEKNFTLCKWAQKAGYLHVGWKQGRSWKQSLDTNDWVPDEETPGYHSPDDVLKKILTMAEENRYGINGGIILMHLGTLRKNKSEQVHRVLGTLIDSLRSRDYTFVKVTEMVKQSGIDLDTLPAVDGGV